MMLLLEIVLLMLVFTFMIWLVVRKDRRKGLHWYPEQVKAKALSLGLTTAEKLERGRKGTGMAMLIILTVLALGSVLLINGIRDWFTAFQQFYLMFFLINLYDGIVVDYLWVQKTSYWQLSELENMPIGKPMKQILRERLISSIVFLPICALLACAVFL